MLRVSGIHPRTHWWFVASTPRGRPLLSRLACTCSTVCVRVSIGFIVLLPLRRRTCFCLPLRPSPFPFPIPLLLPFRASARISSLLRWLLMHAMPPPTTRTAAEEIRRPSTQMLHQRRSPIKPPRQRIREELCSLMHQITHSSFVLRWRLFLLARSGWFALGTRLSCSSLSV